MRLVFLTRRGCHLCEGALVLLQPEAARVGIGVEVVDVDADPALAERFTHRVPVVCDEGGSVLAEGVLDDAAIRGLVQRVVDGSG